MNDIQQAATRGKKQEGQLITIQEVEAIQAEAVQSMRRDKQTSDKLTEEIGSHLAALDKLLALVQMPQSKLPEPSRQSLAEAIARVGQTKESLVSALGHKVVARVQFVTHFREIGGKWSRVARALCGFYDEQGMYDAHSEQKA